MATQDVSGETPGGAEGGRVPGPADGARGVAGGGTTAGGRAPGLAKAYLGVTAVVVALVLVQAAIAGQYLFGTADILVHGYVGNASFALAVVAAVLAVVAKVPRWVMVLAWLLVLALFSQTGLGYVGRESVSAASWHVPLGVASFGVAVAALTGAAVAAFSPRTP